VSNLHVRRLSFDWSDPPAFLWNPENPEFSLQMNATSMVIIAFERYIAMAYREAVRKIDDPALAEEAADFVKQEGQHCTAHRHHVRALTASYPGLEQVMADVNASYDALLQKRRLHYHLAYIADLESAFTPTFKLYLDHEDRLFRPGDERVASLFLWHFTEEVEHRCSALKVYRAFGGELHRLWAFPSVVRHILRVLRITAEGINAHVPFEDRQVDARVLTASVGIRRWIAQMLPLLRKRVAAGYPAEGALACVPDAEKRAAGRRVLLAQLPHHDPEHQPLPEFVDTWTMRYQAGEPVDRWYSSRAESRD